MWRRRTRLTDCSESAKSEGGKHSSTASSVDKADATSLSRPTASSRALSGICFEEPSTSLLSTPRDAPQDAIENDSLTPGQPPARFIPNNVLYRLRQCTPSPITVRRFCAPLSSPQDPLSRKAPPPVGYFRCSTDQPFLTIPYHTLPNRLSAECEPHESDENQHRLSPATKNYQTREGGR